VKNLNNASRRTALKTALAAGLASLIPPTAFAQDTAAPQQPVNANVGTPDAPFTFDVLSEQMRERATRPYEAPANELPDVVANLDYDQHRAIRYRPDHALWRAEPVDFHLQAFHPGWIFRETTHVFIGRDGIYQPHTFTSEDFEYRPPLDPAAFQGIGLAGVAGFRIHAPLQRPDYYDELVTFLGASYFRALGVGTRYGLSARGLAINTATGEQEEFPRFNAFYIDAPRPGEHAIRLMAELDSPSVAGAFLFVITPGMQTEVEVSNRLYFRNEVSRLGIAPLTSMFTFGENDRAGRDDFRPEVHDSDGLCIERADGERLWRPLKNPQTLALSFFRETSPRSFGLLQRDRDFASYEDTEARYELRPSLLVEMLGDWGVGTIALAEIPTDSEANDNIVAFWVPEARPTAGSALEFRYRMSWGLDAQPPSSLATVSGTFVGVGGNAAATDPNPSARRFAINFEGGTIANLPDDAELQPLIDISGNAVLLHSGMSRLPGGGWRLSLEVERQDSDPVEMRVKLSMLQRIISETWLYQWTGTV
jgi:glucans biosynthesis protein